jgi:glutaredoxin 3
MAGDAELERLMEIKAARMRLGLEKPEETGKGEVIVYSTQTCPYCNMAKSYLASRNVKYAEVDVGRNPAEGMKMVQETGESGVPQIKINGQWILGFDRPAIDRALGIGKKGAV